VSIVIALILLASGAASATTISVTLGDQDFGNGSFPDKVAGFEDASVGEPSPFDLFNGSDYGTPFSASWTFTYASVTVLSALLTLGIYDHDSGLSPPVVHKMRITSMH
jgi:hypothetical protein